MSRPPARLIIGNLDCEVDFAALAGRPAGPSPRRVLATIAGMATLLRIFARDGDRLWLPAPVAPEAMAEVPGLPRPILESGRIAGLDPAGEILAWGETAAVARARRTAGADHAVAPVSADRLPWRLPVPAPEAAAAVNDRRFSLALAGELGCRLAGAQVVASPPELEAHLGTTGIERWVLKATFSAAGRRRLIHPGGTLDARAHRRIERLFARHGELVFEPWMERTADVGCAAALAAGGLSKISLHQPLVDRSGRFRGIELIAGDRGLAGRWLEKDERRPLERVLEGVASTLRQTGYAGPFGIDAWRYRSPEGGQTFNPLGEINGRLTFGWVARALVDRLRGPLGIDPDCRVRLMFGRRTNDRAGARTVPLLHAVGPGSPESRLEILDPP